MRLKIKDLYNNDLGVLVLEQNIITTEEVIDDDFREYVIKAFNQGVNVLVEDYDGKNKRFIISEIKTTSTEPNYDLAFKSFLELAGYSVQEEHPELDRELKSLLEKMPEQEAKEIMQMLREMSYLQKTYLHAELTNTAVAR